MEEIRDKASAAVLSAPGRCLIVKLNSDSSMRQRANFAFFTPLVDEEFKALTKPC